MFRFVFAWTPADTWDTALEGEGFVGVECDGEPPAGVPRVGRRALTTTSQGGGVLTTASVSLDSRYAIFPAADGVSADRYGPVLATAAGQGKTTVLIENGGAFRTAAELWNLMEAAHHPLVKVAIDINRAATEGQTAAVLVPTLNLRIGLLRVREKGDEVAAYARRLAGIGFAGWIVLDPPAGDDRITAAREIAAVFRGIFPAKAAKKVAPAKAVV